MRGRRQLRVANYHRCGDGIVGPGHLTHGGFGPFDLHLVVTAADISVTTIHSSVNTDSSGHEAASPGGHSSNIHPYGGATAISFSSTGVKVLWATPNPGFDVRIEAEAPGVKVEFRADHHRSRIDAWWSGGPRHDIREEPEG